MTKMFAVVAIAALVAASQPSRAQDITRFAPLKADELSPAQKAWADVIAVPPRNAKFGAPPYRAYIRNPELAPKLSALSDYLRWNTTLPPRLSEFAIVITARNWTAQYEWAAHYPLALKAGLDAKILMLFHDRLILFHRCRQPHSTAFTISSITFFASPKTIIVLSI